MSNTILQGTVKGTRRSKRQMKNVKTISRTRQIWSLVNQLVL